MMCRTSAVILIFVCLTSFCAQGQISGIVLDKNTNSPIEYATIILKQGDKILKEPYQTLTAVFFFPFRAMAIQYRNLIPWLSEIRNRKRRCQKKHSP